MNKCSYCVNTGACEKCDKNWRDMFIPSDEVKRFFFKGYVGVRGMNGYIYDFDTMDESLVPTHSIRIGNTHYCPYCGEEMFCIQDRETLAVTGYCCLCKGAMAEIEYEKARKKLEEEYKKALANLQEEYRERLTFDAKKLVEEKHRQEMDSFKFFGADRYNHFGTINGKSYTEIDQILG